MENKTDGGASLLNDGLNDGLDGLYDDDDYYCICNAIHDEEEHESNYCKSCGKKLL